MSESFTAYRDRLLSRHENSVTNALSTAGDVVMLGGVVAAVVTRRVGVGVIGVASGAALAAAAHLFQPGTLREEITAILRHPVWAVRAEGHRIFGRRP
ncbi:MAG: hypothetical protein QOJ20_2583 [Mycobacterium sp.]|jgi:hypothetical protein|nr:hypothetical protein [Mycobacterium sp.]MDT5281388.1 hypothetical protein [Mycobacterium sp.]